MSEICTDVIFVRISEALVRRRSEHNDGEICSLEELSLAQEHVGKIEYLQDWCRGLRILLLQDNLISTIENLSRLKKLEYLNLALNCVERVDGLQGCESLRKLDLTLNFVGELTSLASLQQNSALRCLYLTGNPCTDYEGYRQYVVATLPQLTSLDGVDISRSERIAACQNFPVLEGHVVHCQEEYAVWRAAQRERATSRLQSVLKACQSADSEEELKQLWGSTSENCPEERLALAALSRRQALPETTPQPPAITSRLHTPDGCPLNVNQARIPFTFTENESDFVLDIAVYRYLDTTLIHVDVQPTYVTVTIKGKVLQLVFPTEVHSDRAVVRRSQTTGHLQITIPKVGAVIKPRPCITKKPLQKRTVSPVAVDEADLPPLE